MQQPDRLQCPSPAPVQSARVALLAADDDDHDDDELIELLISVCVCLLSVCLSVCVFVDWANF